MKDVPGLFSSFPVLFSFLFFSGPVWERHPSLHPEPVLHPYSSFCLPAAAILIPFQVALHSAHCLAGAVSPAGTSNSSSKLTGASPHAHPSALLWWPCLAPAQHPCSQWSKGSSSGKVQLACYLFSVLPPILTGHNCSSHRQWLSFYTYCILYGFLITSLYVIALYCQLHLEPSGHRPYLKLLERKEHIDTRTLIQSHQ